MAAFAKPASPLPPALSEALARGATIVTPNRRIAHAIRRASDAQVQATGALRWTPPDVLSLDSWMDRLWRELTLTGAVSALLLNRTQEHVLWRGILAVDGELSSLHSVDSLAELAASAWSLLWLYNGRSRLSPAAPTTDTRAFARWARAFEQACTRSSCLSAAQLPAALAAACSPGQLPIPPEILLVDFDTLLPAHEQLFAAFRSAGCSIGHYRTGPPQTSVHLHQATDEPSELQACARWIRLHLHRDPSVRIAVVVPNLADRRPAIARAFAPILAQVPVPELNPIQPSLPFEFSLGQPLSDTPLVAAALNLLEWSLAPLSLASLSLLLLSPFFGASGSLPEQLAAAGFDAFTLRHAPLLRPELSIEAAARLIESSSYARDLAPMLRRLRTMQHTARAEGLLPGTRRRTHAEWAEAFRKFLHAAGWTSAAQAASLSFQAYRRFESALDELATLDFDGSRASVRQALTALARIARQIVFAPESREASVQVLGPLELGGVPFDALWFLGAGDLTWPPPASPNPLLPWALQRSLDLPGSDPARDHTRACALTARIAGSAAESVLSFSTHCEDGGQRPSAALSALRYIPFAEPAPDPPRPSRLVEEFLDHIPLQPLPDAVTHGGTRILELQAACSFRAFAELRLWSAEPPPCSLGLDSMERGSLVHRVLQLFWSRIASQSELNALSPAQRRSLLDESIDSSLEDARSQSETAWDRAYLAAQRKGLAALLEPWLEVEGARPPFTVLGLEQTREVPLGPLRLRLRVDRIDRTDAGLLILDYKTGAASPSDWLSDRPVQPQLPLYAVLSAEPVAGLAFALLRAGEGLDVKGFADSDDVFGKPSRMPLPLADQIQQWHGTLTTLAHEFAAGDPVALPKQYPKTCAFCTQRILCRLDPSALGFIDDAPDESSSPEESSRA